MSSLRIEITPSVLTALEALRIYSRADGDGKRFSTKDSLTVDSEALIEPYTGFYHGSTLCSMGSFCYSYGQFDIRQRLGRYCSIAVNVRNLAARHPVEFLSTSNFYHFGQQIYQRAFYDSKGGGEEFNAVPYDLGAYEPAEIGHDVWIGENVLLGRNIKIGTGAVIGANAVVTRDVEPYAIVAGVPAKLIRYRFGPDTIAKLLALQWWNYSFADFHQLAYTEPDRFADQFHDLISTGKIKKIVPDNRPFVERLLEKILESGEPPEGLAHAIEIARSRDSMNRQFPVPVASANWYAPELDRRDNGLFRFFAHKAWLDIEIEADTAAVEFLVHHAVKPEAINQFEAIFQGKSLPRHSASKDALGRTRIQFLLPGGASNGKQPARLDLFCSISRKPFDVLKKSNDQRTLSVAVSPPKLIGRHELDAKGIVASALSKLKGR